MFKNRYWREYPWFMQMMLLGLMIFTFASFMMVMAYMLTPLVTGGSLAEVATLTEQSPQYIRDAALFSQSLYSIITFLVPAVLFAYLAHPAPAQYLGLQKTRPVHWLLVLIVMLGAIPVLLGMEGIFRQINFGPDVQKIQEQQEKLTKALLTMHSPVDFIKTITVLALVPALSEELLFRGVLMRAIHVRTRRMSVAIAISGVVFALVHSNPVALFPIFFAGVLLGYIYYLTGSLWLSIFAHFLNNGLQVMLIYLGSTNPTVAALVEGESLPWFVPLIGAVVFAISFYALWKTRTPLAEDWSDDFKGEERIKESEEESGERSAEEDV